MAVTQLQLYNAALRALGEEKLSALTDERPARRHLDEVWDFGAGAIRSLLEQGLWNHAMRAVQMDASTSVTPAFGFSYAFDVPGDFVQMAQISADETFADPLTNYEQEGAYFYADVDPVYMRYVSDHASYGGDLSRWPQSFSLWAGHWLAVQIAAHVTGDIDMEALMQVEKRLLVSARSKDAMKDPPRFPPTNSWNRARYGGRGGDRGKRGKLIG